MEKIDKFILDKFQRLSDVFQIYFGKNNFWLARICLAILSISFIVRRAAEVYLAESMGDSLFEVFFLLFVVTGYYFLAKVIDKLEKQALSNDGFKNQAEETLKRLRMWSIGFLPLIMFLTIGSIRGYSSITDSKDFIKNISEISFLLNAVFASCCLYFSSCTPLPAKTSKVKKFFQKLSNAFSTKQAVLQTVRVN